MGQRYDEAEQEFRTAIRLNPRSFEAYYLYGRARFAEGKLDKAARLFEQACEVRPEDYLAVNLLPQTYAGLGRKAEARAANQRCLKITERHIELNPDDVRALYYGAASLVQLGERERGLEWARRALVIDPTDVDVLYNVACVYSRIGDTENAIDCLEKSVKAGFSHRGWIENDSDFDRLRNHPRYQALLKRME